MFNTPRALCGTELLGFSGNRQLLLYKAVSVKLVASGMCAKLAGIVSGNGVGPSWRWVGLVMVPRRSWSTPVVTV